MLHKPISHKSKAWLLYVCLLTMFAGCSKCNKVIEPNGGATGLPPATQVGAYTFGCMLNGQVWIPQGRGNILGPANPNVSYDATFEGGSLQMKASISVNDKLKHYIGIGSLNVGSTGEYNLTNNANQ